MSFKLLNFSTLILSQFISHCLGFSTLVLVPTKISDLVNYDSLYQPVCLFILGGRWFALGPQFFCESKRSCCLLAFAAFSLLCGWE